MQTFDEWAEFISLTLTVPTLLTAAAVVARWWPSARKAIMSWPNLDPMEWFVLGVAVGFAGAFADNVYWGLAWTASFLGLPSKGWLFDNGVCFNIAFRQAMGIFAAYCHLRAGVQTDRNWLAVFNKIIALSYVGAITGAVVLWGLKCW